MRRDRIGLIVTAVLFIGWLGWLAYLAATKTNPVIVSRSQVMAATHFVLAEVKVDPSTGQPERPVTVVEDLRPVGQPVSGVVPVLNIKDARVAGGAGGFAAPGPYLLMLTQTADGFVLAPPPRSPGHEAAGRTRPWAYVWSAPGVQAQFEELVPKRPGG